MEKEESYLRSVIDIRDKTNEELFKNWLLCLGYDKCVEIFNNYQKLTNISGNAKMKDLIAFTQYCYDLSSILFSLLRQEEDYVKAFLSNTFNNYQVKIESRPSNYTKTKYYFKIPVGVNKYLDIRTFSYTDGPVDYYDAIKTLDFGDINLIMSHLPTGVIAKFSKNINIIDDLRKTRELRNYVYHHNLLFSLGKSYLLDSILMLIRNLPTKEIKKYYVSSINTLRFQGSNRQEDIGENIALYIDKEMLKDIF